MYVSRFNSVRDSILALTRTFSVTCDQHMTPIPCEKTRLPLVHANKISNPIHKRRCSSSHGYLVILGETPVVILLNPLTGAKLQLPLLSTFPNVLSFSYSVVPHEDETGKQVRGAVGIKNTCKSHFQTTAPKSCYMRPPGGILAPGESIIATGNSTSLELLYFAQQFVRGRQARRNHYVRCADAELVKTRLRQWAQVVACTVRQSSSTSNTGNQSVG
ncbi:Vesicle-associated protein 4-1 [Morella rubra]|uniref:Vesicle-associated protein 4-1 n=1 Tax=Morella rubra TaxID=262757 RepID=A0A6A1V6T6_9ROSI|nr:Vesicle-associated protein 4-1 [Morella rubra]